MFKALSFVSMSIKQIECISSNIAQNIANDQRNKEIPKAIKRYSYVCDRDILTTINLNACVSLYVCVCVCGSLLRTYTSIYLYT